MPRTFYQTITDAVRDVTERGYVSPEQIVEWMRLIREAAKRSMTPEHVLEDALRRALGQTYARLVDKEKILVSHKGLPRWTLQKVKPQLRAELDRRILAGAGLIKLNRDKMIEETLQRFAGWSTSIPAGGSRVVDRPEVKDNIRKALARLPFTERRVSIDQGHKLVASLNDIIAADNRAIAATWHHHHVKTPRPTHLARDMKTFLIRDSWAHEAGFVRGGTGAYTDEFEQPGELVYCRCANQYLYNLRDVPAEYVTAKGRNEMQRVRSLAA